MRRSLFLLGLLSALILSGKGPARALTFNLTDGTQLAALQTTNPTLYTQVRGGFDAAAALWSSLLINNVTVNITINYQALGSGILGQAGSNLSTQTYTNFRNQLVANSTSALDATVVANLPTAAPTYTVRDAGVTINGASIRATRANMKAVGLLDPSTQTDASITFSSNFSFDFDRSNGISSGQFDFIGIAAHEIGHSLGFTSIVDTIDGGTTGTLFPTAVDLFRFSSSGIRDVSADAVDKFFSVNGGIGDANGGAIDLFFSEGVQQGDGNQASHWKDSRGIGIMDPTMAPGELGVITEADLLLFDAIGWTRTSTVVPEPVAFLLALFGFGILSVARFSGSTTRAPRL